MFKPGDRVRCVSTLTDGYAGATGVVVKLRNYEIDVAMDKEIKFNCKPGDVRLFNENELLRDVPLTPFEAEVAAYINSELRNEP